MKNFDNLIDKTQENDKIIINIENDFKKRGTSLRKLIYK